MRDVVDDLGGGRALEGYAARRHLVENDTQAEEITPRVDVSCQRLLGAHVLDCSHDDAFSGTGLGRPLTIGKLVAPGGALCHAEVEDLYLSPLGQNDIAGLDVTVGDTFSGSFLQGIGDLDSVVEDERRRQWAAGEMCAKVLSLHILHRDKVCAVRLAHVVNVSDIRVVQGRRGLGLLLKARASPLVPSKFGREDFQRHSAPETRVLGEVNLALYSRRYGSFGSRTRRRANWVGLA